MVHIVDTNMLSSILKPFLLKNYRTNYLQMPYEMFDAVNEQRIFYDKHNSGLLLFYDLDKYYRMYYYLNDFNEPLVTFASKPLVVELPWKKSKFSVKEDVAFLKDSGFFCKVRRLRLNVDINKFIAKDYEHIISFAQIDEKDLILEFLSDHFDPYIGFLPLQYQINNSIKQKRILCTKNKEGFIEGVLHFEKTGKVSNLLNIAVKEEVQQRGIAGALLSKWWNVTKNNTNRYNLWVSEKNQIALYLYEQRGFYPDGWMCDTLLKV